MKIAVLGTGRIGGTLGRAFAAAGHDVTFGARNPNTAAEVVRGAEGNGVVNPDAGVAADSGTRVADVQAAVADAEVVVLAVPGPAVAGVVRENSQALGGKLVVDCANNMSAGGPANSHDVIVSAAPGVRYARAFNSLGVENLQDPHYGDVVGDMFYTSSEADREIVEQLVGAVGLRPVWLGDGAQALLDDVLGLWFTLSRISGSRHFAFKVVGDAVK
jgi:8-hydroxy-5-deazaflavin:NADPH oxidoreductase